MEETPSANWRKQADENLSRLHSLLFGAEAAANRGDHSSARILSLRLLGFLHAESRTPIDAAYIDPIRTQVSDRIAASSRALAADSDRQAFAQAKRDVGNIFLKKGDVDIQKVKQSEHFQDILRRSNRTVPGVSEREQPQTSQLDRQHEKLNVRASKHMTQTKITSIYNNKASKSNNVSYKKLLNSERNISTDYIDVDEQCSNSSDILKTHGGPVQVDEEDKPHGIILKTKRRHTEFTSPVCENMKSPSSNEEANADNSGNGFVTARSKLEMDAKQRYGSLGPSRSSMSPQSEVGNMRNYGMRSGGLSRRGLRSNFVPPIRSNGGNAGNMISSRSTGKCDDSLEDSTRKWLVSARSTMSFKIHVEST